MTIILFETITAAVRAYNTLQSMIDLTLDCNAITYNETDEELVRWLVRDRYCKVGAKRIFNIYLKQRLILLVDDDPNLLLLLAEYLDYNGLKPITAESGEEGWKVYCKNQPDVIVSGISMETIDSGYKLLRRVRERDRERPFIFVSSQISIPGKRETAMELGANICFRKPFEPEELLTAIETLISFLSVSETKK
jgi:CheY-like chemotaxis protein